MAKLTKVQVLTLIEHHDEVAINALRRLHEIHVRVPVFIPADERFLTSCAEQVAWRLRDRERGQLRDDTPLLSPQQVALVRRMIQRYADELLRIAHQRASGQDENLRIGPTGRTHAWQQRPDCVWCGAQSVTAYDGNPSCQVCMDYLISRQPPPGDDLPLPEDLLDRYAVKTLAGPTVYTRGGLAVTGRDIRWQTCREQARTRTGMTPEMERELARSYGAERASGPVEDDPFEGIEPECP